MHRVLKTLAARVAEFEKAPLFAFLADKSVDPKQRLAFAPCVAHFVMSFADLYALVLPEEPPRDKYQELVNAHVREDENHWRWFLNDLEKLGSDPRLNFTDALRFVWSDATVNMRMLSYHMCRLGLRVESIQKLVLVHCIEAAGKVTVDHVATVGEEFSALTGKKLVYLGRHHSDTEGDHTLEETAVQRRVAEIELEPAVAERLSTVVDETFEYFTAFTDEMLAFAKSGRSIG